MRFDPEKHHRRSVRLPDYPYQDGVYFVTICTHHRECIFGDVVNGTVKQSEWGEIVCECWKAIPDHFPLTELDAFVVMPNHLHGIILLRGDVGAQHAAPLHNVAPRSLGAVVRSLKSAVTKAINQERGISCGLVWQRNYHEHVIRSEKSLNMLREYIQFNPARWAEDRENPGRT
jgi:REP element-mobilizing transposase RayT